MNQLSDFVCNIHLYSRKTNTRSHSSFSFFTTKYSQSDTVAISINIRISFFYCVVLEHISKQKHNREEEEEEKKMIMKCLFDDYVFAAMILYSLYIIKRILEVF